MVCQEELTVIKTPLDRERQHKIVDVDIWNTRDR